MWFCTLPLVRSLLNVLLFSALGSPKPFPQAYKNDRWVFPNVMVLSFPYHLLSPVLDLGPFRVKAHQAGC